MFSLSPLKARKSNEKRSKELIPKRMQRGLIVLTLQGAIKESPILQYWNNVWLDGTIIISYFGAPIILWSAVCNILKSNGITFSKQINSRLKLIQTEKILLVPQKCERNNYDAIYLLFFYIAIAILDFSLLLLVTY